MSQWREIKGYEGLYLVSDDGRIYALPKTVNNGKGNYTRKGRFLSPGLRGKGDLKYKFVVLTKNGQSEKISVHRIVAETFLKNEKGFSVINHIDRNTLNNNCNNLEWCDQQYNNEYSHNKKVCQYANGEKIAEYKSITCASQITGIGRQNINNALTGWSKKAGGYEWKYI